MYFFPLLLSVFKLFPVLQIVKTANPKTANNEGRLYDIKMTKVII